MIATIKTYLRDAIAAATAVAAGIALAHPAAAATLEKSFTATLAEAAEEALFSVEVAGGTALVVSTRDIAPAGDRWQLEGSGGMELADSDCGDGSAKYFGGAIHLGKTGHPAEGIFTVRVKSCGAKNVFPAQVRVRFTYSDMDPGDTFHVTQVSSQATARHTGSSPS